MNSKETEFNALRAEMLHSDRTCLLIMGYLISITGAAGTLFIEKDMDFAGFIIAPIWIIAFWYFSEKRFVIKALGKYIELEIESKYQNNYGWQKYREQLRESPEPRSKNLLRGGIPFGPYQLESFCTLFVAVAIPVIGIVYRSWSVSSIYFISGIVFFLIGISIVINSNIKYRRLSSHNKTNAADAKKPRG
ncbi:MAG: hypothetical protein GY841_12210 [FCB group bacterium]|nr:hypothetical protein [FCB group bacterium]